MQAHTSRSQLRTLSPLNVRGRSFERAQVRIRYKQKPHNKLIAAMSGRRLRSNELVMRIQPNESLYMTTMSKVPRQTQANLTC